MQILGAEVWMPGVLFLVLFNGTRRSEVVHTIE